MKKLIITGLSLFVLGTSAQAQVCQSPFASLMNAFNGLKNAYQDMRKEAANIILGDGAGDIVQLSNDFQNAVFDAAGVVTGNGPGSVGPRYLLIPSRNITGRLEGEGVLTTRTFITAPSGYDKTYVTIEKTDGRAGCDITVCVKDPSGITVNSKQKAIGQSNSTIGNKASFTFFGTEEKYLSIYLNKTNGLNDFAYKVTITGEMNGDKLQDDYDAYKRENPSKKVVTNKVTTINKSPVKVIKKN